MFTYAQDLMSVALFWYSSQPTARSLPRDFWTTMALEWLVLQTLLSYTYISLINSKNYFKQVLALMWVLSVLSIYLAFMQLELFACFMFVAEFTMVIFFYALFLHLRISTSLADTSNESSAPGTVAAVAIVLVTTCLLGFSQLNESSTGLLFAELYSSVNYVAFSDLTFFAATMLRTNFLMHFLVGLLLLFLTLFLFFVTNIYYFLNMSRRDAARLSASKLATGRGYYEQTAEEVQKVISTTHTKK